MPKMPATPSKRKSSQKTKRRRTNVSGIPRNLAKKLVPSKMRVSLPYYDVLAVDPAVGGAVTGYVFRANNIYDPDYTGTGHQPRFRDELTNIYGAYHVLNAKMSILVSNSSASSFRIVAGISLRQTTTLDSLKLDYIESRDTVFDMVPVGSLTGDYLRISKKYDASKFWSVKDVLGDDSIGATTAVSTPTRPAYFHIWTADSYTNDPTTCTVIVYITYDVVFHDPVNPPSS